MIKNGECPGEIIITFKKVKNNSFFYCKWWACGVYSYCKEVYEQMKHLIIRIMKKLDTKNRIVFPKAIMDHVNTNEFYIELYDDGTIALVPIKTNGGK